MLNEERNIAPLLSRLREVAKAHAEYRFEFVFTDNASSDSTFERLAEEALTDHRIRVIRFTRNFGFQTSILTNYLNARGDAAIQLDADLQDPPELIGAFLKAWESGHSVVYGIRRSRHEHLLLTSIRKAFYRILNRLSNVDIKFRLLSLTRLAIDGICSQSTKPLELITLFGFFFSIASLMGAFVYLFWFFLVVQKPPPGFTTLVILILLSTGMNAAFVGVLGEYIGRIFRNTRDLPTPIIDQRIEPVLIEAEDAPSEDPVIDQITSTRV